MRQIEVMMVGSPVTLGGQVEATITGVCVREKCHVTYECAWWDRRTYNCKWMEQHEVERREETAAMRIGFNSEPVSATT